ncbi:MAG: hypothetical protein LUG98_14545 [Tannerellaceae bacterium]|nr:hypothetical protein [Tannerellaceae bacterium]
MESKPLSNLFSIVCAIYFLFPSSLWAYSLRKYSSHNGLSNSAVQAICQDSDGFMWFGSCDGLNRFDGSTIEVYKPTNDNNFLSGNLIENIVEAEEGFLWIQTNYGLDLLDKKRKLVTTYQEFTSKNHIVVSEEKDLYILCEDDHIRYFDWESLSFRKERVDIFSFADVLDVVIDRQNVLWIFTQDNGCLTYQMEKKEGEIRFVRKELYQHTSRLVACFHEDRQIYFVDAN